MANIDSQRSLKRKPVTKRVCVNVLLCCPLKYLYKFELFWQSLTSQLCHNQAYGENHNHNHNYHYECNPKLLTASVWLQVIIVRHLEILVSEVSKPGVHPDDHCAQCRWWIGSITQASTGLAISCLMGLLVCISMTLQRWFSEIRIATTCTTFQGYFLLSMKYAILRNLNR